MYRKNEIILGAVAIILLIISIPLIPALETSPVKTTTNAQDYQSPFHIKSSTNNFICPILLAITLGFALGALRALESIPEDIQYWIDSYNDGRINALELLIEIVSCTTIDVINTLYAKAGFRLFYNLWHDLCTGPSFVISSPSLISISGVQVSTTPYSVSTSTILINQCSCGH